MPGITKSNEGGIRFGTAVVLVIAALFLIFILQNSAIVDIYLLVWKITVSRSVLLIGSLLTGFVIGLLTCLEILKRRSNR
ncbi:MAG: lipopolysaccharide assembly protein LapA domain-containing protein [Thermodesulfobacteriota bacterium]